MKRFFIPTAFVAALLSTSAVAYENYTPSSLEVSTINRYAPDVDVSTLTAAEIKSAMAMAHGGDSESEKRNSIRARLKDDTTRISPVDTATYNAVKSFAPQIDTSKFTNEEMHLAALAINSGDRSDALKLLRSFEYNAKERITPRHSGYHHSHGH